MKPGTDGVYGMIGERLYHFVCDCVPPKTRNVPIRPGGRIGYFAPGFRKKDIEALCKSFEKGTLRETLKTLRPSAVGDASGVYWSGDVKLAIAKFFEKGFYETTLEEVGEDQANPQ